MGFWKNKLFFFLKKNGLKYPELKVITKVECEIDVNGEKAILSIPLDVKSNVRKQAIEYIYAEVYEIFTKNGLEKRKEASKNHFASSGKTNKQITVLKHTPLDDDNKGHKLLEKLGWSKGEGLGQNKDGKLEPVEIVIRPKKLGLGA